MADCLCGHGVDRHRSAKVAGRWRQICHTLACECADFEAVAAEDTDPDTLIYAWNASLCQQCEWRTTVDLDRCLQCGALLTPVRLEMHSREPL